MATVYEAWRAVFDQAALLAAAEQAVKIEHGLQESAALCDRVWRAVGEELPELEDPFRAVQRALREALDAAHSAAVRLRHLAG